MQINSRHGEKFLIGDNLQVQVARINAFRSEIDFHLVQMSACGGS